MALVAPVEDGKIVETASQNSLKNTSKTGNDSMDKDAFLQLLVAQMKYQDPLEPTSNTEYISQYAQFSQVEQLQNVATGMDLQRASSLVGEEVYVKTTTSSGDTKYIQGKVDYVVYENGKAYLSINEELYSLDDLDTVADAEYLTAYNKASDLVNRLSKLPGVNGIDMTDVEEIGELEEIYNAMTDYEKTFLAQEVTKNLNAYIEKAKEVKATAGASAFEDRLEKLPEIGSIDMTDAEEIGELEKLYNEMTDYEKNFLAKDTVESLNAYIEKVKEIKAAEAPEENDGDTD